MGTVTFNRSPRRVWPWRGSCAALGVALLAKVLSACDPINDPDPPFAIGADSSGFSIGFCEKLAVTAVLIEARSDGFDEWATVWNGEGERTVYAGDEWNAGEVPDGFTASVWEGQILDSAQQIDVVLSVENSDGEPDSVHASFAVPDGGLASGEWLRANGRITDQPCSN